MNTAGSSMHAVHTATSKYTGSSASSIAASGAPTGACAPSDGAVTRSTTKSLFGQPHPNQVALGHAQRPQRAWGQEQRPERVDHLGRDAPLLEQLIVELGQHDARRRPVGEPPILLVLAERGDWVQVRGHGEYVVGRLVSAEPVREYAPC